MCKFRDWCVAIDMHPEVQATVIHYADMFHVDVNDIECKVPFLSYVIGGHGVGKSIKLERVQSSEYWNITLGFRGEHETLNSK